jgi:hypothetical protein
MPAGKPVKAIAPQVDHRVAERRSVTLLLRALSERGRASIRVSGGSMVPTLAHGQMIQVEACTPSRLLVGEIGLFVSPSSGSLFAHRLAAKAGAGRHGLALHVGDCSEGVWLVPLCNVVARVTGHTRRPGGVRARMRLAGRLAVCIAVLWARLLCGRLKARRWHCASYDLLLWGRRG